MALNNPAGIGYIINGSPGSSFNLSTTVPVPSGARVIVGAAAVSNTANAELDTCSGGGLTWTRDAYYSSGTGSGQVKAALFSANAPSGMSTSTLTVADTGGQTFYGSQIGACYQEGIDTSNPVNDIDGNAVTTGGGGTTYQASLDPTVESMIIAMALGDGVSSPGGVTVTSPSAKVPGIVNTGWDSSNEWQGIFQYRYASASGNYTTGGTWNNDAGFGEVIAAVAYAAAAPAPPADMDPKPALPGYFHAEVVGRMWF